MTKPFRLPINDLLPKLFWALAPLLWGAFTWFLAFGKGSCIPLSYAIRMIIPILLLSWYFRKTFDKTAKTIEVRFFGYQIPLINWRFIISLTTLLLFGLWIYTLFFSAPIPAVLSSIIFGVMASSSLEELMARSYFIKYKMSGLQFLFFNFITSISFTLMHAGYTETPQPLYQLFFINGHFLFSFMLGILAYKSKRIEIPLLIHMLSNFLRYTVPNLILMQPLAICYIVMSCIELALLGGIWHKEKDHDRASY